jgi:two-component system chemotaxis response regulator CheY
MAVRSDARILLVDDEVHMRRTVRRMLHSLGYPIVEESDGAMVLETLKLNRHDLVICDWRMEPHSGLEVLRYLRADPDLKNMPFIMLTGETAAAAVIEAVSSGASDYIGVTAR